MPTMATTLAVDHKNYY